MDAERDVDTGGDGDEDEDGEMEDAQEKGGQGGDGSRRAKGGRKHLEKSSRMPNAVYRLYIDMLGFETHNDAVSG